MNIVLDHEVIVVNLLLLKALLTDRFFADFAAKDLKSNIILSHENKFHLVKDEIDLLFILKRAICLDLNFLNYLCRLVDLAILFQHLNKHHSALGVLALSIHLAFAGLPQRLKCREFLLTTRHILKESFLHQSHHICHSSLCLSTPLDQLDQELSHSCKVALIKSLLNLYTS